MPGTIEIVSATRRQGDDSRNSALAQSIARLQGIVPVRVTMYVDNSAGLPRLYNRAIKEGPDDGILLFVHDDVFIEDPFLDLSLADGLERFDIVGVVGNRRRLPGMVMWSMLETSPDPVFDYDHISGRIAHGPAPFGKLSAIGPVKVSCQLIDGVFIAARRSTLRNANVYFDERFRFHCYDVDFCRSAIAAGLDIGTWPIALTHQSGGEMGTGWRESRDLYLAKWGD